MSTSENNLRDTSRARSGSRPRSVAREGSRIGPLQLVAATDFVKRVVVQGDSRMVEVRVSHLHSNQFHVRHVVDSLVPVNRWEEVQMVADDLLRQVNAKPSPSGVVYQGQGYTAGKHFMVGPARAAELVRGRSPSVQRPKPRQDPRVPNRRSSSVGTFSRGYYPPPGWTPWMMPYQPMVPHYVQPRPQQQNKPRQRRRRQGAGVVENAGAPASNNSSVLRTVASTVSGLVLGSTTAPAASAGIGAAVPMYPLVGAYLGLRLGMSRWLMLMLAVAMVSAQYYPVAVPLLSRADTREHGLIVTATPLIRRNATGCAVVDGDCFVNNFRWFLSTGPDFALPQCGYTPPIRHPVCPDKCTYDSSRVEYLCRATGEVCSLTNTTIKSEVYCWNKGEFRRYHVDEPVEKISLAELESVARVDNVANGEGLNISLCGVQRRTLRLGEVVLRDILCEVFQVFQEFPTSSLKVCVDDICMDYKLRPKVAAMTIIPGNDLCAVGVSTNQYCTMLQWDVTEELLRRSFAVNVTAVIHLGSLGMMSYAPYRARLQCSGDTCPLTSAIYGQVRFTAMGFSTPLITLLPSRCHIVGCYQWRALLVYVATALTVTLFSTLILRFGTWKGYLVVALGLTFLSLVRMDLAVWRLVLHIIYGLMLIVFAISVLFVKHRPRAIRLASVYVVLLATAGGALASDCRGLKCDVSPNRYVNCTIETVVRCGRLIDTCPATQSNIAPVFEHAPAVCVPRDAGWDSVAGIYWKVAQRIGRGAAHFDGRHKYVWFGPHRFRESAGYLVPNHGSRVLPIWLVVVPRLSAYTLNIPVEQLTSDLVRRFSLVVFVLCLITIMALRMSVSRTIWLAVLVTLLYMPTSYALTITRDVMLPAALGGCVEFTQSSGPLSICVVNRTDTLMVSRMMTGVECELSLVHRRECDRHGDGPGGQAGGYLATCEDMPIETDDYEFAQNGPKLIDSFSKCIRDTHNSIAACRMATRPHSWCYADQYAACFSYYNMREVLSRTVDALAVTGVVTQLSLAVNGSMLILSPGEKGRVGGTEVELTMFSSSIYYPRVLWRVNETMYEPLVATAAHSGPFTCIRDASGGFSYNHGALETHVRTVGLAVRWAEPTDFIRDDALTRLYKDYVGCGCTNVANLSLVGCTCGFALARVTTDSLIYTTMAAKVVSMAVVTVSCLTVDSAVAVRLRVTTTRGGAAGHNNRNCKPAQLILAEGDNDVALMCILSEHGQTFNIGNITTSIQPTCRVPESVFDTYFKMLPYVPEVPNDGLPSLLNDMVASMYSKWLWIGSVVLAVIIAALICPLAIKLIKLCMRCADRGGAVVDDLGKKMP